MEILSAFQDIFHQLHSNGVDLRLKGCIHIGAHEGQEYPLYKMYGLDNLLFYEPLPDNFAALKEKVGPEVKLRNIALGNTTGTVEMYLEDRGLSSSILEPAYHLEQYPQIEFNNKAEVEITRLDDEEFDRNDYNFINVDVQGYELEVLKGATKTLEHIDLVLSEVNKEELYKGCPRIEDIDSFLSDFGFQRIVEYWQQDGGTWGDALYLKNKG